MQRQPGRKMSQEERAQLSIEESFGHISQFNRRDIGGQNPQKTLAKRFITLARTNNVTITESIAALVGTYAWDIAGEQRDSTANRQASPINDMLRRFKLIRKADKDLKSGNPLQYCNGLRLLNEAIKSKEDMLTKFIKERAERYRQIPRNKAAKIKKNRKRK